LGVSGRGHWCHRLFGGVPLGRRAALFLIWERDGAAYYAQAEDMNGIAVYRLAVEPMPLGGWDWQVWCKGVRYGLSWQGIAPTAAKAMLAAEAAV
jgi:hypothetical protein